MVGVAVAWQMYELTHRALDLGLVQFIPSMLLVLLVGHTADRYDRHRIIASAQLLEAMAVLLLCLGTIGDWVSREILFLFIFAVGVARAFEAPTNQTMMLSQKLQKRLFLVS